jgi:hypothetical protein
MSAISSLDILSDATAALDPFANACAVILSREPVNEEKKSA